MDAFTRAIQARVNMLTNDERGALLEGVTSRLLSPVDPCVVPVSSAIPSAIPAACRLSENDKRSLATAAAALNTYLTTIQSPDGSVVGIRDVLSWVTVSSGFVAHIALPLRHGGAIECVGPNRPNRKMAKEAAAKVAMSLIHTLEGGGLKLDGGNRPCAEGDQRVGTPIGLGIYN